MNDKFWKINKSADENVEAAEKHVPILKVIGDPKQDKSIEVEVDVGEGRHPNTNEHHTQWIELRGNGLYIARAEFSPAITDAKVTFRISVPNRELILSAIARCNLHGIWESREVVIGK